MKLPFVADGELRVKRSPEFQARLRALRESVAIRYAAEFAAAGFLGRCRLRWRMALEYQREKRRMGPSSYALYSVYYRQVELA